MAIQNVDQNINVVSNDPTLADLLTYFKKAIKLEFNSHHVGTIQSFNSEDQTASVTINYLQTSLGNSTPTGLSTITTSSYPTIVQAPCICLGGGAGSITFPIAAGDECVVLFNDRDFDNWFAGSSSSSPLTGRLHAFNDAMILVGVRSMPNVLTSYATDAVSINYEDNTLQLSAGSFTATLPGIVFQVNAGGTFSAENDSGEFVDTLDEIFNDISTGTVDTLLGPQLLNMPDFAENYAIFKTFLA